MRKCPFAKKGSREKKKTGKRRLKIFMHGSGGVLKHPKHPHESGTVASYVSL